MKIISKIAGPICFALASATIYAGSALPHYRLLLSGPVESVDMAKNTFTILGHRFVVKGTMSILPGQRLDVMGGLASNGSLKPSIVHNSGTYGASSDRISMVGAVSVIDRSRGILHIGAAAIDYTNL